MQKTERSSLALSDASYYDRDTWDDWTRTSPSHSQPDESELALLDGGGGCGGGGERGEDPQTRALRAERDALARRLASERARAAAHQRAQDARLAELHGVIAELVRRRASERQRQPIVEEDSDRSDECESSTQPAADVEDDQAECASLPTPTEPPSPHLEKRSETPTPAESDEQSSCASLSGTSGGSGGSGGEERLSAARWSSMREAKVASRVRLRRAPAPPPHRPHPAGTPAAAGDDGDEARCAAAAAARLAVDADDAEDLQGALLDCSALRAALSAATARSARLQADVALQRAALARATDTSHRMGQALWAHEAGAVSLCAALRAADRALETYDVLLALAETRHGAPQRAAAERVARQLLARLATERDGAILGEPLLPPGPWLLHDNSAETDEDSEGWSEAEEGALRAAAARLKRETAALRNQHPPPKMFSWHDDDDDEEESSPAPAAAAGNMADMEAAVAAQEVAAAREERCDALAALAAERARSHRLQRAVEALQSRQTPWLERSAETQL